MELVVKTFEELTTRELYEILRVRSEIFVVEQNCVYQDVDRIDYRSLHVFYKNENGEVAAYLRLYDKADTPGTVQMGRVLTLKHGTGLGEQILHVGAELAESRMNAGTIYIEAQVYAIKFYEREGFRVASEEFLEDGIPHVVMIR